MSILVVGATGLVGGQVAQKLRRQGESVRALVRGGDAHPKVQPLRAAGMEIVDGDLTVPETLALACRGIATVVTTATSMPTGANDGLRRVDLDGTLALIEANLREPPAPEFHAKRHPAAYLFRGSVAKPGTWL